MSRCQLFLGIDDFESRVGPKGKLLLTQISGLSLILFYDAQAQVTPIYLNLLKTIQPHLSGCQIGRCIVNYNNKQFFKDFIQFVPILILYINGIPQVAYSDEPNPNNVILFVNEYTKRFTQRQKTLQSQGQNQNSQVSYKNDYQQTHAQREQEIKERTTIGIPIVGDMKNAVYMIFDSENKNTSVPFQYPTRLSSNYSHG